MPPPDLAGDAPVAQILHPVEVGGVEAFRHEPNVSGTHHGDEDFTQTAVVRLRRVDELVSSNKPMLTDLWFNSTEAPSFERFAVCVTID